MVTPQAGRRECDKCRERRYVERHPLRTSFRQLKKNAKRRGIAFTLTLVQWTKFCLRTNYLQLRGMEKESMTIDRLDHYKGYEEGNIQMITKYANSKRGKVGKNPAYVRQPDDPF